MYVYIGWFSLFFSKLPQDTSKIAGKFGSSNGSNEFTFSRTTSSFFSLSLQTINDDSTTIGKNNTSSRSFSSQTVSKGSVSKGLKDRSIYINWKNVF